MPETTAFIGIDWGTHSSKWNWVLFDSTKVSPIVGRFKILRSEVCVDNQGQLFLGEDAPSRNSKFERAVKGRLIKNPEAAFWAGPQRELKLTLGELTSFSLWYLLGEAYSDLLKTVHAKPEDLEIRFSLPNWVDIAEGSVGRACYEQAAQVACHIFANDRDAWSGNSRPTHATWQSIIVGALKSLNISDETEIDKDPHGFRSLLRKKVNVDQGVCFRFVAESSAAGLAGLRQANGSDSGYLLKLLVVDVGAGSTDVGYVIRSIPPKDEQVKEALCQLPPANTCQLAGEDLSRRIIGIHRTRGKHITLDEAEIIKTGGAETDWLTQPAVKEWIRSIGDHVRAYVLDIPDQRWLPHMPGLQVLVTGGSGVVPGLREEIVNAAVQALRQRGMTSDVIDNTQPMRLSLDGPAARDANRLAVAIGAADPDLPRLSYFSRLDPAMHHPTVKPPPSWTGS
jgi:hypothetical protein